MAGPFRIEGKPYAIAAKSKTVETTSLPDETVSPIVAAVDKPVTTRNRSPFVIIGILCVMAVAAVGLAIYKKNAKA